MSPHWYVQKPVCDECGESPGHTNHLRRCPRISSFGPGFAFCEGIEGHDGPHPLRDWDGALYLTNEDGTWEQIEGPKPLQITTM
jgi:hypothetical protein